MLTINLHKVINTDKENLHIFIKMKVTIDINNNFTI